MPTIKVTVVDDSFCVDTPYNRSFVDDLKWQVPTHYRKWDGDNKYWLVAGMFGDQLGRLLNKHYKTGITIPHIPDPVLQKRKRITVLYIGAAREREDNTRVAFGAGMDEQWDYIFTEDVLKNWFDGQPIEEKDPKVRLPKGSLYLVLGLKKIETDPDKIKTAYRRMAKQWHPDVCREPDAQARFIEIKQAYETLSDPMAKKRYDLGQQMTDSHKAARLSRKKHWTKDYSAFEYKPALRTGHLVVDYKVICTRYHVEKIYAWDDITNDDGRTLVASIPFIGGKKIEIVKLWV